MGPKDFQKNQVRLVRRFDGVKRDVPLENINETIEKEILDIHDKMYEKRLNNLNNSIVLTNNWKDFMTALNSLKMAKTPWCERVKCEENVKDKSAQESKETENVKLS